MKLDAGAPKSPFAIFGTTCFGALCDSNFRTLVSSLLICLLERFAPLMSVMRWFSEMPPVTVARSWRSMVFMHDPKCSGDAIRTARGSGAGRALARARQLEAAARLMAVAPGAPAVNSGVPRVPQGLGLAVLERGPPAPHEQRV